MGCVWSIDWAVFADLLSFNRAQWRMDCLRGEQREFNKAMCGKVSKQSGAVFSLKPTASHIFIAAAHVGEQGLYSNYIWCLVMYKSYLGIAAAQPLTRVWSCGNGWRSGYCGFERPSLASEWSRWPTLCFLDVPRPQTQLYHLQRGLHSSPGETQQSTRDGTFISCVLICSHQSTVSLARVLVKPDDLCHVWAQSALTLSKHKTHSQNTLCVFTLWHINE